MSNWDQALKYQKEYNEGFMVGSADFENKRYTDSIEGRIVKLQESLRTLVTTTISTDMFKDFISGLTTIVDFMNKIIKSADEMGVALPVAFGALSGIFKTIKFNAVEDGFSALNKEVQETGQNINNTNTNAQGFFKTLWQGVSQSKIGKAITGIKTGFANLKTELQSATTVGQKASTVISSIGKSALATKVATIGANVAMTALNMAFYTLIAIGVQKAFEAIYNKIHETEIKIEKLKDSIAETQSNISSDTSKLNSLSDIADEYEKLAKKTKKSSEEQERFNELTNEIAELMPDLVVGYDENNNPILAINDSLDDTIVKLKETIKLEREALEQEQNRLATENTKELPKIRTEREQNENYTIANFKNREKNIADALKTKNIFGTSRDLQTRLNELSEAMDKSESDYNEYREKLLETDEKYQEASQSIQQKIKNNLADELAGIDGTSIISDKARSSLYEFINTLDFGELNNTQQRQMTKGFAELGLAIEDGNIKLKDYEKTLADANTNFQATHDMDAYKESIKGIAEELSNVTGVDVDTWIQALTQQFTGLDYAQMKLASFLNTYNVTYSDLKNGDNVALLLQKQFEDVGKLLDSFSSGEITYDLLVDISQGETLTDLPEQIRNVINAVTHDKKVTDEEQTLILDLTTEIANGSEISDETYEQIQKILTGEDFEITEPLKIGTDTELSVEELKKLQEYFKEQGLEVDIKTNDEALEELKKSVRNSKEYLNIFIKLDAKGQYELNQFSSQLELLDLNKEVELDIITKASQGDLQGIIDSISDLPEEQQVNIITSFATTYGLSDEDKKIIQNAIDNGSLSQTVTTKYETEGEKPEEPQDKSSTNTTNFESKGSEKVKKDESDVEKGAKDEEKKTKFTQRGFSEVTGYMNTIEKQASNPSKKKVNIVVDVIEKVKGAWNFLTGYSKQSNISSKANASTGSSSISDFSNISNNPMETEMSAQSETFSNISSTPTDTTSSNTVASPSIGQRVKSMASKSFGSIGLSTTPSTSINITKSSVNKALEYSIELLQELQNRIDKVNNKLDLLGSKMEKAVGTEKISYLEKQNELYKEQQKLQQELYDNLTKEKTILKSQLKGYGFKFDAQGNLTEYEEILTKLEEKSKKASDASSNYSGKSDKKKKSLEKSADKASEKLDKVKKLTDEYLQLQYTELPNAEKEWQDMANSIKENEDEIERLTREDKLYKFVNKITEINNQLEISSNKLDIIDAKLNNAYGADEITLTKQKLELLNEQLLKQQEIMEAINSQIPIYQEDLAKYGAIFDKDGNISNLDEILNSFQNSEDKEKVSDLIDEYIEKVNNDLPEAEKSYEDLRNTIIETQQDSLEKTKDIEEKITDMIQDQLDKRKKVLEEQADKEIELINKQKEAYNNARDEEDYQKELAEQQKKISDIKKNIELAKKDNSLSGQAKLQELLEQLDEENKSLQDIVQNRTDDMMNKMFEEQTDKIQSDSDKAIKDLEDMFTDQKIAEIVKESLLTGVFTDLDGNITSLQDALINFAETSGEALGITGDLLKNELVGNIESAINYAKEYKSIMDSLQLKSYGNINYADNLGTVSHKNVVLGDTSIIINGNTDDTTVEKIRIELDNYMKEIINKI